EPAGQAGALVEGPAAVGVATGADVDEANVVAGVRVHAAVGLAPEVERERHGAERGVDPARHPHAPDERGRIEGGGGGHGRGVRRVGVRRGRVWTGTARGGERGGGGDDGASDAVEHDVLRRHVLRIARASHQRGPTNGGGAPTNGAAAL